MKYYENRKQINIKFWLSERFQKYNKVTETYFFKCNENSNNFNSNASYVRDIFMYYHVVNHSNIYLRLSTLYNLKMLSQNLVSYYYKKM